MRHEKAHKKSTTNHNENHAKSSETVEVLYQKLGDRWYAFSLIDQEVFVGSISQEEIDAMEAKQARAGKMYKITGNS